MRRTFAARPARHIWAFPFFLLLVVVFGDFAAAADSHTIPHAQGRLWRIERGDSPPSHIIGTVHVADPQVRDLPAPIVEAFEASEQAAFEIRMTPEESRAMMLALGPPPNVTLADLLDDKAMKQAVAMGERYGLSEKDVKEMHPFALSYLFSLSPEEHLRQAQGDLFLDAWLVQWAYDLGMDVKGLETAEEHLQAIRDISLEDHAAGLRDLLQQWEDEPDYFQTLLADYLSGDMEGFFREMIEETEKDPRALEFKEAFLDKRNHKMVERAQPLLERGKAFIAVGAAHLPGEEGMLRLLEERGYRITRVY